ncbi:flagellar basal body-associated FliL family protein [Halobacteriovorax sp. GB3]|uniref:flagellar basal body-associated FliL family protein n=1 Tax=Halobacteriovorax sp. GB3 TaxID=2719615 RepID=UPI00235F46E7|nr:flagellar basal body-associated FliL family protein [Halobacteriovorax sp. GB3]MDD0852214.1 flagellar basal body-associated FliL family protein [Halobacteriovorax sp. GB3]
MNVMTGNNAIDKVLTLLTLLASLVTMGLFVYTEVIYTPPVPSEKAEKEKLMSDSESYNYPSTTKMDKLIINLESRTKRLRFLEVEVNFVTFKQSQSQSIIDSKAIINDTLIRLANEMTPEELNSISGKILFENRVKKSINKYFQKPTVKEIHFSKFIVQ